MSEKEGIISVKERMIKCPKCGEEIFPLPGKVEKELGFLLLGVMFGAVLGIVGNLWVAFLFELVWNFIPPELWTVTSIVGFLVTTIISIYVLMRVMQSAMKHTTGEGWLTGKKEKEE